MSGVWAFPTRFALVVTALALGAPAANATCDCAKGPCVKLGKDVALAGLLTLKKSYWALRLDRATCFRGSGEADDFVDGEDRGPLALVQIAPQTDADQSRLQSLKGKRIRMTGDAFGAHTRYHATQALFSPKTIEAE